MKRPNWRQAVAAFAAAGLAGSVFWIGHDLGTADGWKAGAAYGERYAVRMTVEPELVAPVPELPKWLPRNTDRDAAAAAMRAGFPYQIPVAPDEGFGCDVQLILLPNGGLWWLGSGQVYYPERGYALVWEAGERNLPRLECPQLRMGLSPKATPNRLPPLPKRPR